HAQKQNDADGILCQVAVVRREPVVDRRARTHSHMRCDDAIADPKHRAHPCEVRSPRVRYVAQQLARPRRTEHIRRLGPQILISLPLHESRQDLVMRVMKRETKLTDIASQLASQTFGLWNVV